MRTTTTAFAPLLLSLALLAPVPPLHAGTAPPLMLATAAPPEVEVARYLVSEKLDGVRGYWDGTSMWTRGGARVALPAGFTRGWPSVPMDGELWLGRGRFDEVSALVRSSPAHARAWQPLRFMAFDLPAEPAPFSQRAALLERAIHAAGNSHLLLVRQERLSSAAALQAHLRAVVRGGGEGLMLHRRDALYNAGRSEALLKYKLSEDAEARVVGHVQGKGRLTGKLGALVVALPDGRRMRLGSGFTDAQRAAPPPMGSWVSFRYSGTTSTGLPRFARFLRVREELPPVEILSER